MNTISTGATLRIYTKQESVSFITDALGINPTKTNLRGKNIAQTNLDSILFKESCWLYCSPLSDSSELIEHLSYFAELICSKTEQIKSLSNMIESINLFCMFASDNGQGSAYLSPDMLKFYGENNVSITLDLYPPCK